MEEHEAKQQSLEGHRLRAALEEGLVCQGLHSVAALNVGAQPSRRLVRHFDRALQDVDREVWAGHAGHPQPVVGKAAANSPAVVNAVANMLCFQGQWGCECEHESLSAHDRAMCMSPPPLLLPT